MANQVGEINVKIGADTAGLNSGVDKAKSKLGGFSDKAESTSKKVDKSFEAMGKAALGFAAAYASIGTVTKGIKLADEFNRLEARVRTATKATGDFATVYQGLFNTAQTAGVELSSTVSAFQNIAGSAAEIGKTNQDVIKFVDSFQKLGVIGGSSATEISNALRQTSQAIAGGVLRAEEFNSIVENTPEVARSIARGMNMTVGELRNAVMEGEILSEDVFSAIESQANNINETFKDMPNNLGKASEQLLNSIGRAVSSMDGGLNPSILEFQDGYLNAVAQAFNLNIELSKSETITGAIANGLSLWSGVIDNATTNTEGLVAEHQKLVDLQKQLTLTRGDIGLNLEEEANGKPKELSESDKRKAERELERIERDNQRKLDKELEFQFNKQWAIIEGQAIEEENIIEHQELLNEIQRAHNNREYEDQLAHQEAMTEMERKHSERRYQIAKEEDKKKQDAKKQFWGDMTSLMNSGSKEMFEIGKVAATANVIQSSIEKFEDATKWGMKIGGPPLAAAFGAASIASSAVQIQQIQSQSFGSGASGATSYSAGVPAVNTQAAQPTGGTLTVEGLSASSLFTGDAVAAIATELLDYQREGGQVVLQS